MQGFLFGAVYDPAYAIAQLYAIPVGTTRGNWAPALPSGGPTARQDGKQ
jgi:hypothetical protein